MIFKQFHNESLGHASYFIGSEMTGEAIVTDARRDVDIYFETARNHGMRIKYALDTHQHNDYVSGIREIGVRAEVTLLAGSRSTAGYDATRLSDGGKFRIGEVDISALHTPGHTPEHICLVIKNLSRGEEPAMLLSGGCLLVDDIGRPDLFGGPGAVKTNALDLYRSLYEKIMRLPDHVEVYPTHVAGSLCGGSIGSRLSTTVGYERILNRWLNYSGPDEFAAMCMRKENLPSVPPYWRHMRQINQDGPPLLGVLGEPPALSVAAFDRFRKKGFFILDCRSPEAFSAHIPGALSAGIGTSFPTWAGTVLPFGQPYILVLDRSKDLWDIVWHLLRIGYDLPKGWLAGGMTAWRSSGSEIESLPLLTVWDLEKEMERDGALFVLDVRQPGEWASGHIEGAHLITGAEISERIRELPNNRQIAVICGSGYRSSSVASILTNKGYKRISSVLGGMGAWKRAGFSTTK